MNATTKKKTTNGRKLDGMREEITVNPINDSCTRAMLSRSLVTKQYCPQVFPLKQLSPTVIWVQLYAIQVHPRLWYGGNPSHFAIITSASSHRLCSPAHWLRWRFSGARKLPTRTHRGDDGLVTVFCVFIVYYFVHVDGGLLDLSCPGETLWA